MSSFLETLSEPATLFCTGPGLAAVCTREGFEVSFDIFSALPKPRVIQGTEADTKTNTQPSGLPAGDWTKQTEAKDPRSPHTKGSEGV